MFKALVLLGLGVSLVTAGSVRSAVTGENAESRPAKTRTKQGSVPTPLTARCEPACPPLELYQRQTAERVFVVGNDGSSPIRIAEVAPLSGTGSADFEPSVLAPGQEARVTVRQPVDDALGLQQIAFDLISPDAAPLRLQFPVFVQSAYRPERPAFDFGYARRGGGEPRQISLDSHQTDTLRIDRIVAKPHWLSVIVVPRADSADPQHAELRAVLLPSAPLGELTGRVLVGTNVAEQPEISIPVRAQVYGEVSAMPPVVSFGAVERGTPAAQDVTLRALDGKALAIARVTQAGDDLTFSSKPCGDACVHLRMDLDTAAARLVPRRDVTVWFEGREEALTVPYSGLVVGPDTRVHSLGVVIGDEDIHVKGDTGGRR